MSVTINKYEINNSSLFQSSSHPFSKQYAQLNSYHLVCKY